jgi:tetratricopeptide (TPR) repeat protein
MRLRTAGMALFVLAMAVPSGAVGTWYDYYLDARDKHIPAQRWDAALASLRQAVKLKPESGVDQRTYGMEFLDYFPYYYQGVVHHRLQEWDTAILMFNIEEKAEAVKREPPVYRELLRLRREAEAARAEVEKAIRIKKLKEEVDRLRRESAELHRAGRYEDALSRLAPAQKAAEALDPVTQRDIHDRIQRIRDDSAKAAAAAERAQRIERDLAEGQALLETGKATEAKIRFDSVLAADPAHAAAAAGRERAEVMILASTTEASRQVELVRGKALFDAGRYDEALRPLADAASDPNNAEARELLEKARRLSEGLRRQKDLAVRIQDLLGEGERMMAERRYADAWVRLQSVLELDRSHVKAAERLRMAEGLMADDIFKTLFPNQAPVLTFLEPRLGDLGSAFETWAKGIDVVGVATDDRGVSKLQFILDGKVLAEQEGPADPATGELSRNVRFERHIELPAGATDLRVVAVDSSGIAQETAFRVTRLLPFYLTRAFWPAATASAAGLVGLGYAAQRLRRRRAVRKRFNPYIAGAPVRDHDMFFGRQKLLTRIMNVLHHNSLMITGERRIGKTTFLHHLKAALERDEGTEYKFFPVSTDLQGVPEAGFFHAVMTDVVETLKPGPETRDALRYRGDDDRYDGRDFSHDLQRVIEELKTRTPLKVKLALLIDEVDVLNEYSERINQRLRSIFMKTFSEHLVAIMSGVGIKRIWNSEGSPWYNFFDEIELTAFTPEEGEALVRQPVEGVFRYEADAVERILAASALKPYVIQKFCIHAVNRMLEDGRTTVTAEDVEAVREAVRFEGRDDGRSVVADRASA